MAHWRVMSSVNWRRRRNSFMGAKNSPAAREKKGDPVSMVMSSAARVE
ncbi:MAG: hypothetical protein R3B49_03300 [Phycisphaerales bacterium]